ncbi:MAG: PQQ-like beta-propeller repeat protein [Verrucomicrobiales bacterium]|nr:PQQ-like beta-propeller repeat protein [Verrucomicrobiales bacterium]
MNLNDLRFLLPACTALLLTVSPAAADDWPQWRGPDRDGISKEKGLLQSWPDGGPDLAWRTGGLGEGYSSVAVANGMVYTLGDLEDGSYAIAISEKDGSPVWKTKIGDAGGHKGYPGTRSTPTVDSGQVFVLNQHSDLAALDAKSGDLIWKVNLQEDFGGKMMSGWRYSESPLVDGDKVIITPGGRDGTVLALNRKTGSKIWQTEGWTDTAGYSSVIIATIHGVRQYVQLTGESVGGMDPESGEVLWKADRPGKTAVVTTPVIEDDVVFVTSSYGVGCNAFRISKNGDNWSTEEIYANKEIANHHGGVVLIDGHVYGSSGGTFRCVNLESGDLGFAERSAGKGATTYADGRFYLRAENGPMALLEATPDGMKEVSRFDQPDRTNRKAWAHPVVANGKLFLRDQDILLVYDVSK